MRRCSLSGSHRIQIFFCVSVSCCNARYTVLRLNAAILCTFVSTSGFRYSPFQLEYKNYRVASYALIALDGICGIETAYCFS